MSLHECVQVDCTFPVKARGLCNAHYHALLRKTGYEEPPPPRRPARQPRTEAHYPIDPLLERMARKGVTAVHEVCTDLHIAETTLGTYRDRGVSWATADRLAVAAGFHPAQIWPSWDDDALTVLDRIHLEQGWRQAWLWREETAA